MRRWFCVAGFLALWLVFESSVSWLAMCKPINEQTAEYGSKKDHCTFFNGPVISVGHFGFRRLFIALKNYEHEFVAGFTIVLALSTIGLWLSTRNLWVATRETAIAQQNETRILQRAYLTVIPDGILPFRTDGADGRIACHVAFYNSGNLPAQNVSWILRRKFSRDKRLNDFPISGRFIGNNVVVQQIRAPKGTIPVTRKRINQYRRGGRGDDRWLYVWGRVRYTDGFGQSRFTDFCHRYNLAAAGPDYIIAGPYARYHEHGNGTDEMAAKSSKT